MALRTPEKLQTAFLIAAFLFIAYAVYVSVSKAIEARDFGPKSGQGPLDRPVPAKAGKEKSSMKSAAKADAPAMKHLDAAILSHPKEAKNYVSRAQLKASLGDCSGASTDFSKAASLDKSLQNEVPSELDSCKQK